MQMQTMNPTAMILIDISNCLSGFPLEFGGLNSTTLIVALLIDAV